MHSVIEQVCDQYLDPKNAWMYGNEVHRAMDEFMGVQNGGPLPPQALPFFADWFIFDFPMQGGETPIQRFHAMNPANLTDAELEDCRGVMEDSVYDFFEVLSYKKGQGMRLRGVRLGSEYEIVDTAASCGVGDVFVSRIVPAGGHYEIASMDPIGIPRPSKKDLARMRNEFPILDPRIIYHEIIAAGHADIEPFPDTTGLEDGTVLLSGGDMHADDGCPICVLRRKAEKEGRMPTMKELKRAFKEAKKKQSEE